MTLRDKLQIEWCNAYLNDGGSSLLDLCPRSGKSYVGTRIFKRLGKNPKILIVYPDKNIEESWKTAFKDLDYSNSNIKWSTYLSIEKNIDVYDLVVLDECQLPSIRQKEAIKTLISKGNRILGLSGTLSKDTKQELLDELGLKVLVSYTLNQAIEDGLISDYRIKIVKVDLDNEELIYKKNTRTEKKQYGALTWVIKNKGQNMMLNLQRMRIIHNSVAKIRKVKELLWTLINERVLVFCASNKTAQELGCVIHTSKFKNQEEFDKFTSGDGNHIAVCKIGNTGVSFKHLWYIIIAAFDSNGENLCQRICRSLILDEKGKISTIYIISSTETQECDVWLKKALEFFDQTKIEYIKN